MYKAIVNIKQSTSKWSKVTHRETDAQTIESWCLLNSTEGHLERGIEEYIWNLNKVETSDRYTSLNEVTLTWRF
jgi:hypothetical protein